MLTQHSFNAGTVVLNYVEGPASGPPMVLMHGLGGRWQSFLPLMPSLAFRWHLFAMDHRGHGESAHTDAGYLFTDYATDAVAFVKAKVDEPAVLLGHSLGALIAVQVAARAPETTRAVILEDPPLYTRANHADSPFNASFRLARELAGGQLSTEEKARRLRDAQPGGNPASRLYRARNLDLVDPDVYLPPLQGRGREGLDTDALLACIESPTLLVQADPQVGAALSDEDAERALSHLRFATHVKMEGFGHGIHARDPIGFLRVVTEYLEAI